MGWQEKMEIDDLRCENDRLREQVNSLRRDAERFRRGEVRLEIPLELSIDDLANLHYPNSDTRSVPATVVAEFWPSSTELECSPYLPIRRTVSGMLRIKSVSGRNLDESRE